MACLEGGSVNFVFLHLVSGIRTKYDGESWMTSYRRVIAILPNSGKSLTC